MTGQGLFLADGPHRKPVNAVEVARTAVVRREEVERPRVVRLAGVERPRPVEAGEFGIASLTALSVASSWQEDCLAVLPRGEEHPLHTVPRRPLLGGVH